MGVLGRGWKQNRALCRVSGMNEVDAIVIFHHLRPREYFQGLI